MGFIGFNQKQEATKWGFDRGWTCPKISEDLLISDPQIRWARWVWLRSCLGSRMGSANRLTWLSDDLGFQPQATVPNRWGFYRQLLSQSNDPTTMAYEMGYGSNFFSPRNGFYFWQRTALLCLFSPTPSIDVLFHWLVDFSRGITWMLHKLHWSIWSMVC